MSGDLLTAALAYADDGLPVLPLHDVAADGSCSCRRPGCDSPGKHPRTLHGLDDATTDAATIREWWRRWPQANVGVRTGTPGGIVALDVDSSEAADALRGLADGRDLAGLVVETGRGWHLWYRTPTGAEVRGSRLAPGVDVRGHRGYVVAPPSLHASGRRYRLRRGELGPMPTWLLDLLTSPRTSAAASAARPATSTSAPLVRTVVEPGDARRYVLRRLAAATTPDDLDRIARDPLAGFHNPTGYGRSVLATACDRIRNAAAGERHSVVNKSAYILGGYLAATGLDPDEVTDALQAAAEDAGLVSEADKAQTERTIESGLKAGAAQPRPIPERAA